MGYVLSSTVLVNILDSGSQFNMVTCTTGQMFHIDSSSLHSLGNVSDTEPAVAIICFCHERPEDFSLAGSLGTMSDDVESLSPPAATDIGTVRTARSQFWPILKDFSMYSLRIEEDGLREPHWHPNTAEMGYVDESKACMSIMDLDGAVDTLSKKGRTGGI